MIDEQQLLNILNSELDVGEATYNPIGVTAGVVVDTDDPLQCGRLRVYCANLNDDPKKLHHLPWCSYLSPYGGSISNSEFTRGAGKGTEKSSGANAYGFWGIPEQGSIVLVTCIDGDERRRVWMGNLQSHQETHTLFHGRYEWEDGKAEGPLSSTKQPLNPQYENADKAFKGEKGSAEWKTRQAEYQANANVEHNEEVKVDQQFTEKSSAEIDPWVKPIIGSHGYDWSGNKSLGSFLASRVFGFSTPGFHAFSMDDRAYNNRIRLRSSTGHQIILDDTNERIYIATNEGKSWIEMDSNGNIDGYSERRINMTAKEDINFSTGGTFRVKADKGIYMYAGDTTGQPSLPETPEDGEIRFHSTGDMHTVVEKNLRMLVMEDYLQEVAGNSATSVGDQMFLQVESGIDVIVNEGNYQVAVNGDYSHNVTNDSSFFAGNDNIIQATNDTEIFSYAGKMDIGSQLEMSVKSYSQAISMEAIEGNIKMSSNGNINQVDLSDTGITMMTESDILQACVGTHSLAVSKELDVQNPDIGCLKLPGVNVTFTDELMSFDAPVEIQFKAEGVAEAITKINEKFNTIEEKYNTAMASIYETFNGILGDPFNFEIPFFNLPSFVFDFGLPALELPEFDFTLCVDYGSLLNVQSFNPFPDGGFFQISTSLSSWSIDSIKQWAGRQKRNFENLKDSFDIVEGITNALDVAKQDIKNDITNIKNSINDIFDVSNPNKIISYREYTTNIQSLYTNLGIYNTGAAGISGVPTVGGLENELSDITRTNSGILLLVDTDTGFNTSDFSGLESSVAQWEEYEKLLGGV